MKNNMIKISEELTKLNIEFTEKIMLSSLSTFRIGGVADCIAYPKNECELTSAIMLAKENSVKFEVVGNCSNILFSDEGYRGLIICTKKMSYLSQSGTNITAQCGVKTSLLSALARDSSLSGLEFAQGIPATVGGAIAMNAGAYGGEMSEVVISVRAINTNTGEVLLLGRDELAFSYRKSIFTEKKDLVCTLVNFDLKPSQKELIDARMRENAESRRQKQPLDKPSCGSYFKRPEGYFAAKLIDDCNLKGLTVGGATVSEKHAGFIVNMGGATARDVLTLADQVRDAVYKKYGVLLESEVKYID